MIREEIRLKTEAKEKQKDTYPKEGQKGFQATNVVETSLPHKVDTQIGKLARVSDNTVRKVRPIREKATPEQKAMDVTKSSRPGRNSSARAGKAPRF